MSFYKTSHPEILSELERINAEKKLLIAECKTFKTLFFAQKVLYSINFGRAQFGSFVFEPRIKSKSWTLPGKNSREQRIRTSIKGATKEEREEHKLLQQKWINNVPKRKVDSNSLYEKLGIQEGDLFFNSLMLFEFNQILFIKTGIKLNDRATEILGSEYSAAEAEYNHLQAAEREYQQLAAAGE